MPTSISPNETLRLSRTHLAPSGSDFDYPFADYDHERVFLTAEDFMERWNRNRRMDAAQQKDGLGNIDGRISRPERRVEQMKHQLFP